MELRRLVGGMLPRVDISDALLEVQAWTGCFDAYTHISEARARIEDLPISIAAVLVAEACNIGFRPVVKPGVPALTRDRLSHVDQNYVRAETHAAANGRLVDFQAGIELAQAWGGGLVASVDGLRFVVPVATINAAPNPHYFGIRRGATWLNAVNDQYSGIGAIVVPGTVAGRPAQAARSLEAFFELNAEPTEEPGVQPWRLLYAEALYEQGDLEASAAALREGDQSGSPGGSVVSRGLQARIQAPAPHDLRRTCVGFEAKGHGADSGHEAPATVLNSVMEVARAGASIGIPGLYVTGDPGGIDEDAKVGSLKIRIGLGWAKSHVFTTGQCPVMRYHRG
jgi:Tn3 transposase DDE domain